MDILEAYILLTMGKKFVIGNDVYSYQDIAEDFGRKKGILTYGEFRDFIEYQMECIEEDGFEQLSLFSLEELGQF